jgi:hypothetical protein
VILNNPRKHKQQHHHHVVLEEADVTNKQGNATKHWPPSRCISYELKIKLMTSFALALLININIFDIMLGRERVQRSGEGFS